MPTIKVLQKVARVETAAQLQTVAAGMCAGTIPIGTISLKPATTYTLTAPLILAKLSGGSYSQLIGITIETDGRLGGFYDDAATSMARIVAPDVNSPIIAIHGGRGIVLRNLKLVGGSNYASLAGSAFLTAGTGNNMGDRVGTESNFTATAAARTNRYSPSCCIAIDPFGSAVTGSDRYPGVSTDYYVQDVGSSRIQIENCVLQHSQVGILVGAGVSVNSAECSVNDVLIHGCKYGVSICHAQAKNWHFKGLSFYGVWGVVTGNKHGLQIGPLPFIWNLNGSQANYLLEAGNSTGGPWSVDGGLCESIMRISPTSLTGGIGTAGAGSVAPGVIRNMLINWAGGDSDTTANIHAGCAPLTFDNVTMFSGGSTKKNIISTSTTAWSDGNLLGMGVIFRGCNIRMNDVTGTSTAADAIGLPASHVDDWIYFDNSYITGAAVGPSNTRLMPMNGRGGL